MSEIYPEQIIDPTANRLEALQVAAGELGLRLVRAEPTYETEAVHIATREELVGFADQTSVPKAVAFKSWRRLQELYTSRVIFETVGITTDVPHTTSLIFRNTPPLPHVRTENPDSWVAWRQTLTDLDTDSLKIFIVQLDNAESRFGRNPRSDLLGKHNGPVMFSLLRSFADSR